MLPVNVASAQECEDSQSCWHGNRSRATQKGAAGPSVLDRYRNPSPDMSHFFFITEPLHLMTHHHQFSFSFITCGWPGQVWAGQFSIQIEEFLSTYWLVLMEKKDF